MTPLGVPRLHLASISSTNERARELAAGGAPHGTLVTAREQTAGRGRQGRAWSTPPGRALAMSLVLHDPPALLPLSAAVAVAETAGDGALIKWPNDVLLGGRKVAGILVEARAGGNGFEWAVLGIGINVAAVDFPEELRETATSLGLDPADVERFLERLLVSLTTWLAAPAESVLTAWRARDALLGSAISWNGGAGTAAGVNDDGRLLVDTESGLATLDAGEVHLSRA